MYATWKLRRLVTDVAPTCWLADSGLWGSGSLSRRRVLSAAQAREDWHHVKVGVLLDPEALQVGEVPKGLLRQGHVAGDGLLDLDLAGRLPFLPRPPLGLQQGKGSVSRRPGADAKGACGRVELPSLGSLTLLLPTRIVRLLNTCMRQALSSAQLLDSFTCLLTLNVGGCHVLGAGQAYQEAQVQRALPEISALTSKQRRSAVIQTLEFRDAPSSRRALIRKQWHEECCILHRL